MHIPRWNLEHAPRVAHRLKEDFQVHEVVSTTMKRQDREAVVTSYAQTGNKVKIQGKKKYGK